MWGMWIPDGWKVAWSMLPLDLVGLTSWRNSTVTIDPECPAAMQRCSLAHELIHVERGPVGAPYSDAEELAVERETARRLVGVRELGEAMVESDSLGHVAEVLHVDKELIITRLTYLHPAERAFLKARLERIQQTA